MADTAKQATISQLKTLIAAANLSQAFPIMEKNGLKCAAEKSTWLSLEAESQKHVANKTQFQGNEYEIHTRRFTEMVKSLLGKITHWEEKSA